MCILIHVKKILYTYSITTLNKYKQYTFEIHCQNNIIFSNFRIKLTVCFPEGLILKTNVVLTINQFKLHINIYVYLFKLNYR